MSGEGSPAGGGFSPALFASRTLVRSRFYTATAVNVNSAAADVASFTGLPAKYRVVRLMGYNASIDLTTATIDLRTAAAGAGTAIISAAALSALTTSSKFVDVALTVTDATQTASTLTLRNVTAQGSTATASFVLELLEVP